MIVTIPYNVVEDNAECTKEGEEYVPYGYNIEYEFSTDEVEFDADDLRDIVNQYVDDVIDIILKDERLRKVLYKKFVEIATNTPDAPDKPSGE